LKTVELNKKPKNLKFRSSEYVSGMRLYTLQKMRKTHRERRLLGLRQKSLPVLLQIAKEIEPLQSLKSSKDFDIIAESERSFVLSGRINGDIQRFF